MTGRLLYAGGGNTKGDREALKITGREQIK